MIEKLKLFWAKLIEFLSVKPTPTVGDTTTKTGGDKSMEDMEKTRVKLKKIGDLVGIPAGAIDEMVNKQLKTKPDSIPNYWAFFNVKLHSSKKRLWVLDVKNGRADSYYITHGKNSDPNYTGYATIFSNTPNSLCTSLGVYRTAETYQMSGHGRALRLDGLDGTNSNARDRGVVFHGVSYASDSFVKANGRCGRSWGCPAVDQDLVQGLIDKLKGGSLLLISNKY